MRCGTGLFELLALFALVGCSKENPGWLESESGGGSQGTSTSTASATTDPTMTTASATTDPTGESSSSTGGEPLVCPTKAYCPFFTDVADGPDAVSCDTTESYVAFRDATRFYRCADPMACDAQACAAIEIDLPPEYAIILNGVPECILVEHESKWIDGTCRTRSLALWNWTDTAETAAPRIILAAHEPAPPPSLSDLSVTVDDRRAACECNAQGCPGFIVPSESWCCGGTLSLGAYTVVNDLDVRVTALYESYLAAVAVAYRGCNYEFRVTQSHDGSAACGDPLRFQAGWYMQRLNCN